MPQVSLLCSAKICLLNKALVQNNLSKGDAEWLLQPWLTGSSFFKWKDSQDILILRSHLLNSWLITVRVLVWECIKAWGIHITSVLSSEQEGEFILSQTRTWQRPRLGTRILSWENGSFPVVVSLWGIQFPKWIGLPFIQRMWSTSVCAEEGSGSVLASVITSCS